MTGNKPFKHITAAGSWEYLHEGHRYLLTKLATLTDKLTVTIYNTQADRQAITDIEENWKLMNYRPPSIVDDRITALNRFLSQLGITYDVQGPYVNPLESDPFTLDSTVEASVTSAEGFGQFILNLLDAVQKVRVAKGFKPIKLLVLPTLFDGHGVRYSSGRIRSRAPAIPLDRLKYAMDISHTEDTVTITHKGETRRFSTAQLKQLVSRLLAYYEEGATDLDVVIARSPDRQFFSRAPLIDDDDLKTYWMFRWNLYRYVTENHLFPITLQLERFWSALGENVDITGRDDIIFYESKDL